mgnify:CR=1 FL=1
MAKKTESWDSDENVVASNWVKFNVPLEDKIMGTLVSKKQIVSTLPDANGKKVWVYELKGDEGSYHTLDEKKKVVEPAVDVGAGSFYSVGGTKVIDQGMQNILIGQKVGLKFIEEVASKTKGFAPAKIVKVYAPKGEDGSPLMDDEFLQQRAVEEYDATA